jgi:hypothetical protein
MSMKYEYYRIGLDRNGVRDFQIWNNIS